MTTNPEGLQQTRELLYKMENSVAELLARADSMHPSQLALLLEGPMAMVQRLRSEIDECLGIDRAETLLGGHDTKATVRSGDQFGKLLSHLRQLDTVKIAYDLRHSRSDAIVVAINVPGERWEVEFLEDGEVVVERFASGGEVSDESALVELFARYSDAEPIRQKDLATGWAPAAH